MTSQTQEEPITFRGTSTRWAMLAVFGGLGFIFCMILAGMVFIPRIQSVRPVSELQKSDAATSAVDDYYVDLTLMTRSFLQRRNMMRYLGDRDPDRVLPVLMGIHTHTGSIEHVHDVSYCGGDMFLEGGDGTQYPALTEPIVLSSHHNAYLVLFPSRDRLGRRFLDLDGDVLSVVIKDLGEKPERRFEWELPISDDLDGLPGKDFVGTLILILSVSGALLVVLSPCAVELTLYYSAIITSTISVEGGEEQEAGDRRRLYANLGSFVLGFTILYGLSGATVGLIGQGVRSPLGEYGELIQVVGGLLILFFALRVLGVDKWVEQKVSGVPVSSSCDVGGAPPGRLRRWLTQLAEVGLRRAGSGQPLGPRDSFLVGLGLSASCLTCMGSAVLYPLLVYAGITSWYWGLITLTIYSLGISIPMLLVALGSHRLRATMSHRREFGPALRLVSGVLLVIISLLVMSGNERVLAEGFFQFLGKVSRWTG